MDLSTTAVHRPITIGELRRSSLPLNEALPSSGSCLVPWMLIAIAWGRELQASPSMDFKNVSRTESSFHAQNIEDILLVIFPHSSSTKHEFESKLLIIYRVTSGSQVMLCGSLQENQHLTQRGNRGASNVQERRIGNELHT